MSQFIGVFVLLFLTLSCSSQKVVTINIGTTKINSKEFVSNLYKYPFDIGLEIYREFRSSIGQEDNEDYLHYVSDLKSLLISFGKEEYIKRTVTPFYQYLDSIEVVKFINDKRSRRKLASKYIRDNKNSNTNLAVNLISNDSLFIKFLEVHSKFKINNDVIYFTGVIGHSDLLNILQDSVRTKYFDLLTVELALARNGIDPYYNIAITRNRIHLKNESHIPFSSDSLRREYDFKYVNLLYINSKESTLECLKLLRTNLLLSPISIPGPKENRFLRDKMLSSLLGYCEGEANSLDELASYFKKLDYYRERDISVAIEYFENNFFDKIQPNTIFPGYYPYGKFHIY